tara:strand:- start:91439 stop:91687 length:249 start_codon:yes stop_codon:yes gene_type:complete
MSRKGGSIQNAKNPIPHDVGLYAKRNLVERSSCRMKDAMQTMGITPYVFMCNRKCLNAHKFKKLPNTIIEERNAWKLNVPIK